MVDAGEWVRDAVRGVFAGRRVVLAGGPAAGATARLALVRDAGAVDCLVIATSVGTGPLPDAETILHELPAPSDVIEEFRSEERFFANPTADVVDALDRFDPDASALVLAPPFFDVRGFGSRAVFGARRWEWVALEDKTTVDELFDAARVPRPRSVVVPVERDALRVTAARCDRGDGTVWAGDARGGFNGGAVYVHWVRDDDDAHLAFEFFASRCDRVRVAPFVEGIPCSIHGLVTDDGIAVFRPVELVTLRAPDVPRFRYAGAATFFDPPSVDRDAMRAAARRVGEILRERAAFRGVFTVDGILSTDGWVATECNPRFGAGLGYAFVALRDVPLLLLHHVVAAGSAPSGLPVRALEDLVCGAGDAHRWGGAWTTTGAKRAETTTVDVTGDANGYRHVGDGEQANARLSIGPGTLGGFVRLELHAERTPRGPSVASRGVAAFAFADAELAAGVGPLAPARDVRGSTCGETAFD